MRRRPPRSTQGRSSAASDVYKRQVEDVQGAVTAVFDGLQRGGLRAVVMRRVCATYDKKSVTAPELEMVVDAELCAGCGECAGLCQFAAISVDDGLARIDAAACMGCGVCVAHCPQGAISLLRDPARGIPLEIHEFMVRAAK